jgi:hypothetical protein
MKKSVQKEEISCDICGAPNCYNKCLGCGKDICWECKDKGRAVEYKHAVNFSGSGDGTYCHECDKRLAESGDALHAAYRAIATIRQESKSIYESLSKRGDAAEANLKSLLPK